MAQFNANSLRSHLDFIKATLLDRSLHIISISETWLHSFVSDDLLKLENYFLIRNDREGKEGGGVACYIHCSSNLMLVLVSKCKHSGLCQLLLTYRFTAAGTRITGCVFDEWKRVQKMCLLARPYVTRGTLTFFCRDTIFFFFFYIYIFFC